jgi:heme/copper-type cytochrome/quinol oxidase subunit 2
MKDFINWLRPTVEGKDGKSSARALTNVWYVVLNSILSLGVLYLVYFIIKSDKINDQAVNAIWALIWLIAIYNLTVLAIFGIVTAQNLTELARIARGASNDPITVTTKAETEITQAE